MYCLSRLHYKGDELYDEQSLRFSEDIDLLKAMGNLRVVYLQDECFHHDDKLTLYDLDIDEFDDCLWYNILYKEEDDAVDEVVIFTITKV